MNKHLWSKLVLSAILATAMAAVGRSATDKFPTGTFAAGDWAVTFSSDGSYQVKEKGDLVVEGKYEAAGEHVTFTDKQGRYACSDSDGKYTWKYDGKALTFAKLEDDCSGRQGVLTGPPLVKQAE